MGDVYEVLQFVIFHATRFVSPAPVAVEWLLAIFAGLMVAAAPRRGTGWLRRGRALLRRIAASSRLSIAICAALPVAIRLAMLPVSPVPVPSIHDEFSHLLLADTLAHGRLTNPTPAAWPYLESIHVIVRPTYNSMYPPAHAVFLAFGQVLLGTPWAGVLIGVGLMSGAFCWMMRGWLPPAWALYGSLVAVLKIGIVGLYVNSYVACAVPAVGGALLVGALPRLRRPDSRAVPAVAAAIGIVVLMNSRPFEGAVLTAAGLCWIAPALFRRWRKNPTHLLRVAAAPLLAMVALGAGFAAFYNWRVTGSPSRMPYQVNRDTYGWPENLAILPAKQVVLDDPVLKSMYAREVAHRNIYRSVRAFLENLSLRAFENWTFFIGPVLTVPLLLVRRVFLDRRTRPLVFFLAAILGLNLLQMVLYPYHLAPVAAILFAIVAQAARHMYAALGRRNRRRGLWFAFALPLCLALVGAMKHEAAPLHLPQAYWERASEPHGEARADVVRWLSAKPGKHLVVVRYARKHPPDQEWVYNGADIDGSRIVWARERIRRFDERLPALFPGRRVWLLEADAAPARVVPYDRPLPPLCPTGPGPAPEPERVLEATAPLRSRLGIGLVAEPAVAARARSVPRRDSELLRSGKVSRDMWGRLAACGGLAARTSPWHSAIASRAQDSILSGWRRLPPPKESKTRGLGRLPVGPTQRVPLPACPTRPRCTRRRRVVLSTLPHLAHTFFLSLCTSTAAPQEFGDGRHECVRHGSVPRRDSEEP